MRKQIWIPCLIVLTICLLLVFLKTKRQSEMVAPVAAPQLTNQPIQVQKAKAVEQHQATNFSQIVSALVPNPSLQAQALAKTNPIAGLRLGLWQSPIEFYGMVVDESNNPVVGAHISFHWMETPSDNGSRSLNAESDVNGLFSLRNAAGPSLTVSVSKEGYYTSRSTPDGYHYSSGSESFHPDALNPVVFHLLKKGQGVELITSANGIRTSVAVRVPKDNTAVRVDFFQKKASVTGQLEIRQIKPPFQGATNWSFSLSIPDGGLVENQDEFQFEVPETGYQSTIEYNFVKGDPDWTTQVSKQFYISFGNPRKYGWLRIESNLAQETVFLTYAINPDGSRNLEPAN
jgi:hypothetical protein